MKTYKGKFKPKNPQKYVGDVNNIIYRSRWESVFMTYLDRHSQILEWSSEQIFINYLSPVTRKFQRYFPDFLIKKKNQKTGEIERIMIEIKPFHETQPPSEMASKKRKKTKNRLLKETQTYAINKSKWTYAIEWCKKRDIKFIILTEKELNL